MRGTSLARHLLDLNHEEDTWRTSKKKWTRLLSFSATSLPRHPRATTSKAGRMDLKRTSTKTKTRPVTMRISRPAHVTSTRAAAWRRKSAGAGTITMAAALLEATSAIGRNDRLRGDAPVV